MNLVYGLPRHESLVAHHDQWLEHSTGDLYWRWYVRFLFQPAWHDCIFIKLNLLFNKFLKFSLWYPGCQKFFFSENRPFMQLISLLILKRLEPGNPKKRFWCKQEFSENVSSNINFTDVTFLKAVYSPHCIHGLILDPSFARCCMWRILQLNLSNWKLKGVLPSEHASRKHTLLKKDKIQRNKQIPLYLWRRCFQFNSNIALLLDKMILSSSSFTVARQKRYD